MATYKAIKRITGNNKSYAEAALSTLIATCWWIDGSEGSDIIYLRTTSNDWVAVHAAYEDEGTEFTTVGGKSVCLTQDADCNYIAVEAVEVE